jgi:hypothetical protein
MANGATFYPSGAVEGDVDEAVLRRIVDEIGGTLGSVYGKRGKASLLQRLSGFNSAARFHPWVVLADLDHDWQCAPLAREAWLSRPATSMLFRIAVREVEAWILADRQRMAQFLAVSESRVPADPEVLDDPKSTLVDIARRSRRKDIKLDLVPRLGSGAPVGAAYTSRLIEFVSNAQSGWRPRVAAQRSDSLRRCLERLEQLRESTL